jgi:hypothetical protein
LHLSEKPEPGPPQFAEVPALAALGLYQTLGCPAGMTGSGASGKKKKKYEKRRILFINILLN